MTGKKTKLEEGAISKILVADTDSESGADSSNVEDYFEEDEEEENNNKGSKPLQKSP
jgi:hypothetical protein